MASILRKLSFVALFALVLLVAFIIFSPKAGPGSSPRPEHEGPAQATEAPVDFASPLLTQSSALVCPLAVALDRREGYGLKGAIGAHLSIFGHDEAVQKLGCEEWREGLPISLTSEGVAQAKDFQSRHLCGMVDFSEGLIFSCSLRNLTKSETEVAGLQRSARGLSEAMKDPSKVRLMECMGVNPWKEKPLNWTEPAKEECAALQQKLGITAQASNSAVPGGPPEQVAVLIKEEDELNDKCRDGAEDAPETAEACAKRELLLAKIKAKNWCWGHDGQSGADRTWEPCRDDAARPASTETHTIP